MTSIAVSAPGKLVLLGEYAVLFGHPALVMAVDRRARVTMNNADGPGWRVRAPGFAEGDAFFEIDPERGFRWLDRENDNALRLDLVERVLSSLIEDWDCSKIDDLKPADVVLVTDEFFLGSGGERTKLGLGSSAALTVSLTEALCVWSGSGKHRSVSLTDLVELHRSFQGGRGSGIDLAASLLGGVVEYRLEGPVRLPVARGLEVPNGLVMVPVFTGRSASTSDFLARLYERLGTNDNDVEAALAELGRVSAAGVAHLGAGDVSSFLDDIDDFAGAMSELGEAAGIPVVSEEHRRLGDLARKVGIRYKPSGAGGGDVGLGFADDPEAASGFRRRGGRAGISPPRSLD